SEVKKHTCPHPPSGRVSALKFPTLSSYSEERLHAQPSSTLRRALTSRHLLFRLHSALFSDFSRLSEPVAGSPVYSRNNPQRPSRRREFCDSLPGVWDMFDSLSEKFEKILKKLRGHGVLTEQNIAEALK